MRSFFSFPNPVNELAARTVAAGVVVLAVATLLTREWPLLAILAAGFLGRVLAGPRLSILGWAAQRVVAPRLGAPRLVPGPPKRFAQGIGATLTVGALGAYALGASTAAWVLVALVLVAATLEAVLAFCFGCWIFGRLQRVGLIPESVCEACSDIRLRQPAATV